MSDIVCIKREIGDGDAAMWRALYDVVSDELASAYKRIDQLAAELAALKTPVSHFVPTLETWQQWPNAKWIATDSCGCAYGWTTKPSLGEDNWIGVRNRLEIVAYGHAPYDYPDWRESLYARPAEADAPVSHDSPQGVAHALISIAQSLATLASCVSDHDATYKYLRTQPGARRSA